MVVISGSFIKRVGVVTDTEYMYNDPLGGVHPFDTVGSSIKDENNSDWEDKFLKKNLFMLDSMAIFIDKGGMKQGGVNIQKMT